MAKQAAGRAPLLTRRTVLAAAAAGGAGVAAARLIAGSGGSDGFVRVPITGGLANAQGLDWVSPLGDERAKVAHLLRRTTFGHTEAELDAAVADGYARTVEKLVDTPATEPPPLKDAESASAQPGQQLRLDALRQWWLEWIVASPTPFAERMTFFWHGHFTTDYRKVGLQSPFLYWQNLTWRKYALGSLREFLYQVTIDPAMLRYLDLSQSTGRSPNENYSRELMELFALGVGSFTEDDVRAAAKGLAGWREPRTQAMVDAQKKQAAAQGRPVPQNLVADKAKTGVFERNRAYVGGLAFLGATRQWDAEAVIDQLLKQDATAPFIARKMAVEFVSPTPSDSYVAQLAGVFRRSRYDIKELMRTLLLSPEFTAKAAYRSLIRSPIEYMVSSAKALGNLGLTKAIDNQGGLMGQTLFDPPSVGGWPRNESWVSSNAMLARANFVTAAVNQTKKTPPIEDAHVRYLDSVLGPQTLKMLNETKDERRRWMLVLASPEFQLK